MSSQVIAVSTKEQLDSYVYWLQSQGFVLTSYWPPTATLTRSRSISCAAVLVLMLVGWIFFWLPLFIYLIWYAVDHADLVTVQISRGWPTPTSDAWWWDGSGWQSSALIPEPSR